MRGVGLGAQIEVCWGPSWISEGFVSNIVVVVRCLTISESENVVRARCCMFSLPTFVDVVQVLEKLFFKR